MALLREETPLTIVMVTRNDADCVGGAVRSLLAQEGGPWCIRIVDDASEEDNIINEYKMKSKCDVCRTKILCYSDNRN